MNDLDKKILENFPGKVVRKDLTALMKRGVNVPTYVLEYLLGSYTRPDQTMLDESLQKIRKILSENYVRPDQSEYIKSKIRENKRYTIIDKISVFLDEKEDKYIAQFTNLHIHSFEVSSSFVIHNEKLLLGGIWCLIEIEYINSGSNEEDEESIDDLFSDRKKKTKKKTKYESPFRIVGLRPIQMPNLNVQEIINKRKNFTKDEWISLILRSAGYEPDYLTQKQKFHYLLRLVPLIQKNYNLVELGPRGTGKSHVYSELSPYSILMSSGHTSVANMFYNMGSHRIGLVGNWDCIAFDEVSGIGHCSFDMVQIMKNYMANGSFARGTDSINADASIAFEGNTTRSIGDMLRTSHLFEPFPSEFNNDSAFFDRIHAYLPGWETPKLTSSLITDGYGLITDCLSEFCHEMRKYDFTDEYRQYFEFNDQFNKRDEIAVTKTFSGLMKIIYPDGNATKEELREILEYSIEGRRRVKEQLNRITPTEFKNINLGYIDVETNEEYIVSVPEIPKGSLVFEGLEIPGHVYSIGKSENGVLAVYKLENKKWAGSGKLEAKNIEGLTSRGKEAKNSINAAFNYFGEKAHTIFKDSVGNYDYGLYFNDLQSKGISEEVSVAEVVGLCSALCGRSVKAGLVVVGRVVMSGSMMPISSSLIDILTLATSAGAKHILLPKECETGYSLISDVLQDKIDPIFYINPIDAAKKALGLD